MIYDRFDEKITIKSRDSVSQPTWGGPGYVGKTGTHSTRKRKSFVIVYFREKSYLWLRKNSDKTGKITTARKS